MGAGGKDTVGDGTGAGGSFSVVPPDPPQGGEHPGPPLLQVVPVGVLVTVAVVLFVLVVVASVQPGHHSAAAATTAPASRPVAAADPAPPVDTSPPPATVTPGENPSPQQAAERAELAAEAARLTTPVSLTSPAGWDRWLPAGKPYPGASTEEDIATCPHLADRLRAALGKRMSYWTGTLPGGPVGCTWVPVPLSYDGPYHYAYLLSVGYLADGTTTHSLPAYENGPERCPQVDVPAVGPAAVLVRCASADEVDYSLRLSDVRRPGGLWVLDAGARTDAPHSASQALDALIAAVGAAYG
jgi:hypothetical protein